MQIKGKSDCDNTTNFKEITYDYSYQIKNFSDILFDLGTLKLAYYKKNKKKNGRAFRHRKSAEQGKSGDYWGVGTV